MQNTHNDPVVDQQPVQLYHSDGIYSPLPINQLPNIIQQPEVLEPNSDTHLQPTAIVQQPNGAAVPAAPGSVWMPLPPTIPGVPPGLEYLTQLDTIQIYRINDAIEISTNWYPKHTYVIKNIIGQQCYYAFEESDRWERQQYGPQRGFVMHIVDNFKREVLTINRDFKFCGNGCGGCCCCECCLQECTVSTPTMGALGTIRQKFGCLTSNFDVMDANGQLFCEIDGSDCCVLFGYGDKEFSIRTANTDQAIGAITKKWGGFFREAFNRDETFIARFPKHLDVKLKGVLLGATFLIDFMHFEQPNINASY
ncbi:CBN-SCRM-4 protein [Caenorhabditis brenneri]|uniref:Phospholipid scramblase n=1 Tax=Caenorhabditis brenneri TaxID=135651 RepID=G0M9X3_CAEBE|nr:CBN-SCRM-4 protein [Caenorhabditis brenneri]